jgi:hypothetical protein
MLELLRRPRENCPGVDEAGSRFARRNGNRSEGDQIKGGRFDDVLRRLAVPDAVDIVFRPGRTVSPRPCVLS